MNFFFKIEISDCGGLKIPLQSKIWANWWRRNFQNLQNFLQTRFNMFNIENEENNSNIFLKHKPYDMYSVNKISHSVPQGEAVEIDWKVFGWFLLLYIHKHAWIPSHDNIRHNLQKAHTAQQLVVIVYVIEALQLSSYTCSLYCSLKESCGYYGGIDTNIIEMKQTHHVSFVLSKSMSCIKFHPLTVRKLYWRTDVLDKIRKKFRTKYYSLQFNLILNIEVQNVVEKNT